MSTVLTAESIAKRFGGRPVLTAATLRARTGEITALLGRNGAGKSTLLRIASGQLRPDSGVVWFAGRAYLGASHPRLAREGLFFVPMRGLLSRRLTVGEHLRLVAEQWGTDGTEALDRLRIASLVNRLPDSLSGGERRRVEVALALASRPRCLLADEPYLGVTSIDVDIVTEVFQELAHEGCAVIITGHEVSSIFNAATRITWCTDGTTYELGPPSVARTHERFQREYLGYSTLKAEPKPGYF